VTATIRLRTGVLCRLQRPGLPWLGRYHVLSLRPASGHVTSEDVEALLVIGRRVGRQLGLHYFGDPEAYTLLFNAARTRRSPWPHVHIIPAASVRAKRWALTAFFFKHLTRALRAAWLVVTHPGGRLHAVR